MVGRQLTKAGTGVVGNYRAACRSRSHAEFTARTGIGLEEADESELWIDITAEKKWGDSQQRAWLQAESRQLRAISAKSYDTARRQERRRHR